MVEGAARRVAFFLPSLGGGGAERVALATANHLAGRGHEVDMLLTEGKGELVALLDPSVRVIELEASRLLAALPPLVRYLRQARPDALQALMWPATIIAILAHRLARSRARLSVSDHTHYSQHFRHIGDPRQLAAFRWTARLFYPRADARIACSAAAAADLADASRLPLGAFTVIHSPVSPPPAVASTPEAEAIWAGARRRIIAVGSMSPVKNHALLLRAVARLDDKDARLVLLGDGPERARLTALADALGIADRLVMPGFVLDPWPFLASAQLFVLSSSYEGSPVALAEAMAAGLRIVSTDCVSGPAELLDGGRFGRLVPCGDEAALAEAMAAAFAAPHDSAAIRQRALSIAGPGAIARYGKVILGEGAEGT